jgi:hypothetical protein
MKINAVYNIYVRITLFKQLNVALRSTICESNYEYDSF